MGTCVHTDTDTDSCNQYIRPSVGLFKQSCARESGVEELGFLFGLVTPNSRSIKVFERDFDNILFSIIFFKASESDVLMYPDGFVDFQGMNAR